MKDSSKPAEAIEPEYGYSHMARAREEKRREENDNPPVTHQIHPKPPFKTIRLYVPWRDAELVRVLKEAMERDSSSVSAWFLDRAREWYKGHAPGNPQTPLEKYEKTREEDFQSMTLANLRQLWKDQKIAMELMTKDGQIPSEVNIDRFRRIQWEIEHREALRHLI